LDSIFPPVEKRIRPVLKTTNILNVTGVKATEQGVDIGSLAENGEAPYLEEEIAEFKKRVYNNPNIINNLISIDGKTTAIAVPIKVYSNNLGRDENGQKGAPEYSRKFLDNYRREISFYAAGILKDQARIDKDKGLTIEYHLAGGPVFASHYINYVERDSGIFLPLTMLVIIAFLLLIYRNIRGALLPVAIVVISVIWTFGLMGILGYSITLVSTILYPLVLVIGLAVVIHILNQYYEEVSNYHKNENNIINTYFNEGKPASLRNGYKKEKLLIIQRAVSHIFAPCFWTSVTTSIGFASLGVSKVVPIAQTGLMASWGVMATFFVAIILTPIMLIILPIQQKPKRRIFHSNLLSRILKSGAAFNGRFYKPVLIFSILLLILTTYAATKVKAETNLREYFKKESPIHLAHSFLEEKLAGVTTIEFAIDGKQKDSLKNPAVLRAIEKFQEKILQREAVSKTTSISDLVKMMNQAMGDGKMENFRIPDTRQGVSQLLILFEQDTALSSMVDFNYSYTYISARFQNMGSGEIRALVEEIMADAPAIFSGVDVNVKPMGATWLAVLLEKYIIEGQIKSFALAMSVISIFMFIFLRSFSLGMAALLPNILPIFLTLGFMGLAKIPINLATCMVPSIAIGIAVDDTIHFLNRYKRERKSSKNTFEACEKVMTTTGQAIVLTSVILFAGFSVLLMSSFVPNIYFGALTAFTMASALFGDLVLLPGFLINFNIKSK